MSILSMLSTASGSANTQYSVLGNTTSRLTTAAQKMIDAANAKQTATPSSTSGSSVAISDAAKAAAAEKADNAKDFTKLGTEVRQALDAQYAAAKASAKPAKAVLSGMTGRAVATVALNRDGSFSRAEVAAAKLELRERARSEFVSASSSGSGLAGLATYNKQIVSQFDGFLDVARHQPLI